MYVTSTCVIFILFISEIMLHIQHLRNWPVVFASCQNALLHAMGCLCPSLRAIEHCYFYHAQVIEMPEHHPGHLGGTMRLGKRRSLFCTEQSVLSM